VYEGYFFNNQADGYGIMQNRGWRYEGEFKEGMWEGNGAITRIDGMSYNGQFVCGEKHGRGVF